MITINKGHYLNGMPSMDDMTINFDGGVSIRLTKETYVELVDNLNKIASENLAEALEVEKKVWNKLEKMGELKKDVQHIFYEFEDGDDFLFKKSLKDLKKEEVDAFLEKYNDFLGIE